MDCYECRSDVFHSPDIVHRCAFIPSQSVILLKSCPVAFSTTDFVISPEIWDKGLIFSSLLCVYVCAIGGQVSFNLSQV